MTRIVVVSPTPTWPLNFGNRKRIHRVCRALKEQGAEIHFILYALENDWRGNLPSESLRQMRQDWDEVHIVIPTVPYHQAPEDLDHTVDEWWDPALEKFVYWYLETIQFDALIVNYLYLSRALTLAPDNCTRILDTHDRFGERRQMLASQGISAEFFHTTEWEEGVGIKRADLVLAIKDEEKVYFQGIGAKATLTLPYCEDIAESKNTDSECDPEDYLHLGIVGAKNSVNRRNISAFLDEALPRFHNAFAPLKVLLAGSMCKDLERYRNRPNVEMMGYVDDISEFYDAVDVVAVPMESSSGQKIKTGEALGFNKPLIAHTHAFEGYQPTHPYHEMGSFSEMAEACIAVSFDRGILTGLKSATAEAQATQVERHANAIKQLLHAVADRSPTALFLVDTGRYLEDPLLRLNLASTVEFASTLYRLTLHFSGSDLPSDPVQLDELAKHAKLVFSPEVNTATAGYSRVSAVDRADLRSTRFDCIWLYKELDRDDEQQVAIATSRISPYGFAPRPDYAPSYWSPIHGRYYLEKCSSDQEIGSSTSVISAPYFTTNKASLFISPNLFSGPYAIYVIAHPGKAEDSIRLANALAKFDSKRTICLLTPTPSELLEDSSSEQPNAFAQIQICSLSDTLNGRSNYKPILVLDMSRDADQTAPLLNYFQEFGFPVVESKPKFIGRQSKHMQISSTGMLHRALLALQDGQRTLELSRKADDIFSNGAGMSTLYHELKQLTQLHSLQTWSKRGRNGLVQVRP